jgi:aromatic ring hydroxylase
MGYKHKATMYYSDEETVQFLNEHAHKRNGKKSVSHYLYSLVTKEREKAISTKNRSEPPSIQLYQQKLFREYTVKGGIDFTFKEKAATTKKSFALVTYKEIIYKELMNEIDNEIKQSITRTFINNPHNHISNNCFIVIRTHISIETDTTFSRCKGKFTVMFMVINLSHNEHGEFKSKFNLEKIRYYKHETITDAGRHIHSALCKLIEVPIKDPIGAFFIPVMPAPKQILSKYGPGDIIIMGVDIYSNQYRFKMKEANKGRNKHQKPRMSAYK